MLWAKVWVGNLLARWWVDVATAVHYYEAILATLAILVWHFYQVFFDPDVYPMNGAWLDGKMPVEQYREEHGLDTESLQPPSGGPSASIPGTTGKPDPPSEGARQTRPTTPPRCDGAERYRSGEGQAVTRSAR